MDVLACVEASVRRGRNTSRTSSCAEAVRELWHWYRKAVMVTTWKKYSSACFASSRTGDASSLRPHCEGPTSSAHAAAMARSARAKAALIVVGSEGSKRDIA
jgi:hypothetical protein